MDNNQIIELLLTLLGNLVMITTIVKSKLKAGLSEIKTQTKELSSNGGSSLADTISKIYDKTCKVEGVLNQLSTWKLTWMELSNLPVFLIDSHGKFTWVNNRFLKITGLTFMEALGNNWYRTIHPADRESTIREYETAVKDSSLFYKKFRIINQSTNEETTVDCRVIHLGGNSSETNIGTMYLS